MPDFSVGDAVKIFQDYPDDWIEAENQVGLIIGFGKRLHIPAAKVLVLGEVAEFDLTELQLVHASGGTHESR
tara:strand:- start:1603 stop:1818 length:216 start_codon:yes stop_codon:yes gene_type:complete